MNPPNEQQVEVPVTAVANAMAVDSVTAKSARSHFGGMRYRALVDSLLQAAAPSIRQQERERIEAALLSKESLTAIFGGEHGEEEVEPLREILATLKEEDH